MTLNKNEFNKDQKELLRAEIKRVSAQYDRITRENLLDDGLQRVVLSLPKSVIYLALFMSFMEEDKATSLSNWQCANSIGPDETMLHRNLNRKMRCFPEDEIMTRLFVKYTFLKAECRED